MKALVKTFSGQIKLLLFLNLVTTIPVVLILLFSPFEVPHIQYLFFGILFVLRIIFFREDEYKKGLKQEAREKLLKKLKRTPSTSEIVVYIDERIKARDMAFFVTVFLLLFATVILTNI